MFFISHHQCEGEGAVLEDAALEVEMVTRVEHMKVVAVEGPISLLWPWAQETGNGRARYASQKKKKKKLRNASFAFEGAVPLSRTGNGTRGVRVHDMKEGKKDRKDPAQETDTI